MAGQNATTIVSLACQIAKCPGYTQQAGQMLNAILDELCQTYDFALARGTVYFTFDTGSVSTNPNVQNGSAYTLPADFLRADKDGVFWTLNGVPYPLIAIDLSEFDRTVQQAGLQSYPYWYATDVSVSPAVMYIYPPPSANYPVTLRYQRQMPDIAAPELSTDYPWFPNPTYLITRLAGEMMKLTDDGRWQAFLGDGPEGAQGILDRYLKMKDDSTNRAMTVSLDRRRFGTQFGTLPNTKTIGW